MNFYDRLPTIYTPVSGENISQYPQFDELEFINDGVTYGLVNPINHRLAEFICKGLDLDAVRNGEAILFFKKIDLNFDYWYLLLKEIVEGRSLYTIRLKKERWSANYKDRDILDNIQCI